MRFLTVLAILGLTITMAGSPALADGFAAVPVIPLGQSPVGPRAREFLECTMLPISKRICSVTNTIITTRTEAGGIRGEPWAAPGA